MVAVAVDPLLEVAAPINVTSRTFQHCHPMEERVWAAPYLIALVALLVIGLHWDHVLVPTVAAQVDHTRPPLLPSLPWPALILPRPLRLSLIRLCRLDHAGLVQGRIIRFHLIEHEVDQVVA